jgi:hypothetical protein
VDQTRTQTPAADDANDRRVRAEAQVRGVPVAMLLREAVRGGRSAGAVGVVSGDLSERNLL